jgi:hypothetical protein
MSVEETDQFLNFLSYGLRSNRSKIHLTNKQLRILQTIVYNLFFNSSIDVDEKSRKYFNRNIKSLKALASKRVSPKVKRGISTTKRALLRRVVAVIKEYIDSIETVEEGI